MLDAIAFDRAYRDYNRALINRARLITKGSADAEDMAQEAWLRLWKYRTSVFVGAIWSLLCKYLRYAWWTKLEDKVASGAVSEELAPEQTIEQEHSSIAEKELSEGIDAMTIANGKDAPETMKQVAKLMLVHDDGPIVARIRGVSKQSVAQTMKSVVAALKRQWGLV